ncbi:MAG: patatin-like phospholipase family protein, partial [Gemmatimonadota bacterium]
RAVATDLRDRRVVVLASGDLAEAVRASMSLPLILQPVVQGDSLLVDGGLSANIPIAVARSLGARRVIISDVSANNADSLDTGSPLGLMNRLLDFLFVQPMPPRDSGDVYIRPDVTGYRSLDFSPESIDRLIHLGGAAAQLALAGPHCQFRSTAFKPSTLPARIGQVEWRGAQPADDRFVARTLKIGETAALDTAAISKGLRSLATGERYRGLWLRPSGAGDSLRFSVDITPASRRIAGAGLAYSSDLGGRVWLGVLDRNLAGSSIQGSAVLLAGQIRQELQFDTRLLGLKPQSMVPLAEVRIAHESVRFFSDDSARGSGQFSQTVNEGDATIAIEQGLGGGWFVQAGPYGHLWHESPRTDHAAAGLQLKLGTGSHSDEPGFNSEVAWTTEYTRLVAVGTLRIRAAGFRFGGSARFGWGRDLPPQLTLPLGGSEGFPGVHYGELRGDREAMALAAVEHSIVRPVTVYLQGAAGQTANGGAAVPSGRWWVGGRVGLAVDTPLGPIRVDYGVTRDWRDLVTVRVGHWF